jgi:hypothetical protein
MEDTWRALLRKYMAYVFECEGTFFLPDRYDDGFMRKVNFEDSEIRLLEMLEQEAIKEYHGRGGASD